MDLDATTPEGKARNRVLSGKGTGEQVNAVVKWCIGLEGGKLGTRRVGRGKVPATTATTTATSRRSEKPNTTASKQHVTAVDDAHEDLAAQDAAADAAGWESGSVNSDDDEEDRYPLMSESEDEDEADGTDAERPTKRTRLAISSPPPAKKPAGGSSLFLPTLASGFTMGGYDSDPDEDDRRDKKSGKGGLIQSVRKNRRGQAERRKCVPRSFRVVRSLISVFL